MTSSESLPIACALGSGDFKDGIGWIENSRPGRSGAIVAIG